MSDTPIHGNRFYRWIWLPIIAPLVIWGGQQLLTARNEKPDTKPPTNQLRVETAAPTESGPMTLSPNRSGPSKAVLTEQKPIILED